MTEPLPPPPSGPRPRRFAGFTRPETSGDRVKMAVGLLGGIAVSGVAWGLFLGTMAPVLIGAIILGKFVVGMACLWIRGWRPLGQGLLASMAVGALIFLVKFCSGIGG